MKLLRARLKAIGKAVLAGRPDAPRARATGHVWMDPSKHLVVDGKHLADESFAEKQLDYFCAVGSHFLRCSFRQMTIEDACWGGGRTRSRYIECCFDGARFRSLAPGNARFVGCTFRDVEIDEFYGHRVEFVDCVFSGRIARGYLNGTRDRTRLPVLARRKNEISGNDFSKCDLNDFAFRTGVDLTRQKLPGGPPYLYLEDAARALENGRAAVNSWEEADIRRSATVLLDIIEMDLKAGQKQQLLRLASHGQFATASAHLAQCWKALVPGDASRGQGGLTDS
jgi:hypothetical protein